MFKKTLIASGVTLALAMGAQSVQANPLTNLASGFLDQITNVQFDARRGGGVRRSSGGFFSKKSSSATSTKSSNTVNKTATPQQNTAQQNTNTQQNTAQQQTNQQYQQNPNMQPMQRGPGLGGTFASSLIGAGAGVLLANMLLTPAAAAAQGTEIATPDMLSDEQIKECLTELDTQIKDAEQRLSDAAADQKAAISEELSQMQNLQISLMKEQLNRVQNQSATPAA